MKMLFPLMALLLLGRFGHAQAPAQINYQGVARNSLGSVIADRDIRLRLVIHESSADGAIVYQEVKTLRTNRFGLFTVAIGAPGATSSSGNLQQVNWASGVAKYLQVEMDPAGGVNFLSMGSSQLLSVPYALYAASAVPGGNAGGDLSGSYPNPTISAGAVTAIRIADGAVSTAKISSAGAQAGQVLYFDGTNVIWSRPVSTPAGAAGGDLTGTYPNPGIAAGAIGTSKLADNAVSAVKLQDASVTMLKLQDGAVTGAKLAPGVLPSTLPPSGAAGGDLRGTYPNPTLADGAVTTQKLVDNAITSSKIQNNAVVTSKLQDGSVTDAKLADNAVTTSKILDGAITAEKLAPGLVPGGSVLSGSAGGDLSGTYPNPNIAPGAVTNSKIANGAVVTPKLADGAVTTNKIADGAVTTSKINAAGAASGQVLSFDGTAVVWGTPSGGALPGTAGGDLTGTYPNPLLANNVVTSNKIAGGAVTTDKISATGASSGQVLSYNGSTVVWSQPATGGAPSGAAGGDLGGSYPNPLVAQLRGIGISTTAPASGQVLKFNGTQWVPAADNAGSGMTLPYSGSGSNTASLLSVTNTGTGAALDGINSATADNVSAVIGRITATSPGALSAGVKGSNSGTGTTGIGVYGTHAGKGYGVYGSSAAGTGVFGSAANGIGVMASSVSSMGLYASSEKGNAAVFEVTDPSNSNDVLMISNAGQGSALSANSVSNSAITAMSVNGPAVMASSDFADGIQSFSNSAGSSGIVGANSSDGNGVWGVVLGQGAGIKASSFAEGGIAFRAELGEVGMEVSTGNVAVFRSNGSNVARIDQSGKAYFNGGTTNSGADVAETFSVEGSRNAYEPGDVLIISQSTDRTVEKSATPYSTLVAGVYATKPGLVLTESNAADGLLSGMVPMGVIGVIPTKVCTEGGAIRRGDLLVTSSVPGVAMKADPEKVKVGQVIGKALQDYAAAGTGKINVLVSIK